MDEEDIKRFAYDLGGEDLPTVFSLTNKLFHLYGDRPINEVELAVIFSFLKTYWDMYDNEEAKNRVLQFTAKFIHFAVKQYDKKSGSEYPLQ